MNGPTAAEVDAAVRAVLASRAVPARATRGDAPYPGRLLGVKDVAALPNGTRRVRVVPGTVVTPLALDALKRLGIALERTSAVSLGATAATGTWGLAVTSTVGIAEAFRRNMLGSPEPWHDLGADVLDAARWVGAKTDRAAVVLTDNAAVVGWRANRCERVRSATAHDAPGVLRAVEGLGANLLAIEPHGASIAALRYLCDVYRRAGTPRVPAWIGGFDAHGRGDRPGDAVASAREPAEGAALDRAPPAPVGLARRDGGPW